MIFFKAYKLKLIVFKQIPPHMDSYILCQHWLKKVNTKSIIMVSLSVHRDTVACSYLSTAYHIKQRAISHSQLPCYSAFTDLTLVCKGPD